MREARVSGKAKMLRLCLQEGFNVAYQHFLVDAFVGSVLVSLLRSVLNTRSVFGLFLCIPWWL